MTRLRDPGEPVTGAIAARRLGVRPSTICYWRSRGRLAPVATVGRSPVYRWGDVLAADVAARETVNSSRNLHRRPRQALTPSAA